MIRVDLPAHLRTLAGVSGEVTLDIPPPGQAHVTHGDADRPRARWLQRRGWNYMPFVDRDLANPSTLCREWLAAIADAPARIAALDPVRSPEVAAAWRAVW